MINKLKFFRQEAGLNQHELELATFKRVPRWRIQLIENGYCEASEKERQALSEALGIFADKVFPQNKGRENV
jgi:transcriptional regulator with XRE-family HTH domain